jgi:hypothetical protein
MARPPARRAPAVRRGPDRASLLGQRSPTFFRRLVNPRSATCADNRWRCMETESRLASGGERETHARRSPPRLARLTTSVLPSLATASRERNVSVAWASECSETHAGRSRPSRPAATASRSRTPQPHWRRSRERTLHSLRPPSLRDACTPLRPPFVSSVLLRMTWRWRAPGARGDGASRSARASG